MNSNNAINEENRKPNVAKLLKVNRSGGDRSVEQRAKSTTATVTVMLEAMLSNDVEGPRHRVNRCADE